MPAPAVGEDERKEARRGAIYACGAFFLWGVFPVFFKLLSHVPVLEIVAHRALWAILFLIVPLSMGGRWRQVRIALATPGVLVTLAATALLLTVNWLIFVWGVNAGRILEVSLGYYINPLFSVLLGMALLKERLSRWQVLAVVLAAAAVLNLTFGYGQFPWVSLSLAVTFGIYGYLRKVVRVAAVEGLFIETMLIAPFALGYLLWLGDDGVFRAGDWKTLLLLVLAGGATAVPLMLFSAGARRLRLSTIGLFQYIGPSIQFVLGVVVYGEAFTTVHMVTFAGIWLALAIYSADSLHAGRRLRSRV